MHFPSRFGSRLLIVAVFGAALNCPFLGAQTDTVLLLGREDGASVNPVIQLLPGESGVVEFFYEDPTDNIDGFQVAVTFPDGVTLLDSFSIDGTIAEAVGAEFLTSSIDNSFLDGDGVEFVAGLLLDAVPPFDGQTLPPTPTPLKFAQLQFSVGASFGCGMIEYTDGIDADDVQPFVNLALVGQQEITDLDLVGAQLCVETSFIRSDCNGDGTPDLADVIFLLQYLFVGSVQPGCREACQVNADSVLDVADAIFLITYLFNGGTQPSDPFPDCGSPADPLVDCQDLGACA